MTDLVMTRLYITIQWWQKGRLEGLQPLTLKMRGRATPKIILYNFMPEIL